MSDQVREDFEKWAYVNGYDYHHQGPRGEYIGGATAIAWDSWQASRAALCVELPEPVEQFMYENEVREAITKTGVRVK